jgi:hypothetical protein
MLIPVFALPLPRREMYVVASCLLNGTAEFSVWATMGSNNAVGGRYTPTYPFCRFHITEPRVTSVCRPSPARTVRVWSVHREGATWEWEKRRRSSEFHYGEWAMSWKHYDLTMLATGAPLAISPPSGYVSQNAQHVVYQGNDNHIIELRWVP